MDNAATQTITALETLVIVAILSNECRGCNDDQGIDQPVWVEYIVDDAGIEANQLGGILSSLTKKGLGWSDGETCAVNQAAVDALNPAIRALYSL
jgi:hypothetical protein